MHAQTLRTYDKLGLVQPERTHGGKRKYSEKDVDRLLRIQHLSQEEGINLAGIKRIVELENKIDKLEKEITSLKNKLADGEIRPKRELVHIPRSSAVVIWTPRHKKTR